MKRNNGLGGRLSPSPASGALDAARGRREGIESVGADGRPALVANPVSAYLELGQGPIHVVDGVCDRSRRGRRAQPLDGLCGPVPDTFPERHGGPGRRGRGESCQLDFELLLAIDEGLTEGFHALEP